MAIPLAPTSCGYEKMAEYFTKMQYCDLEVSAVKADFDEIFEVGGVSVARRERRKNRTNSIECDVSNLKDMFAS